MGRPARRSKTCASCAPTCCLKSKLKRRAESAITPKPSKCFRRAPRAWEQARESRIWKRPAENNVMRPDPATAVAGSDARRFLSTLIEINHEITSILDLDELLKKIAELTNRIVPYEIFAIFLVDDDKQELYLRFTIGHRPEVVKNLRIKLGDGVTGTAALERTTVVVDDVRKYPRYIEAVKIGRASCRERV